MADRDLSTFCCIPTPFDEDRALDEGALGQIIERVAGAGVGVSCGTASPGEGHALTHDETERLYGITRDLTRGRVPAIGMGCEPRHVREFEHLIRIAESVGLDSMQLYSVDLGHGNKPADKELERYFRDMLDLMTIPARISSHKAAGFNVPLPILERLLADYPSIVAIHCITDDLLYLKRVIELADGRCDVLGGGFHQVLNILAFGGQGFLDSTCALLVPKTCRAIVDCFSVGDLEGMNAAIEQVVSVAMINRWTGPRTVKAGMRAVGLPGSYLRPPYLDLDADEQALVVRLLQQAGVPELLEFPELFGETASLH